MSISNDEIMAGLATIISEEIGIDPETVKVEQTLSGDLDIDSLSRLTIATHAEDTFNVTIPDEEIDSFLTVGDLVEYISSAKA
ncbi:MAG: acyl carrier protein [Cellulomonadaceae bacterium]|nr:acyl carrier protein [Cellulomonadaceae bacterium]